MKYILSGTNRPGSRSRIISGLVQEIYKELGEDVEIIDLSLIDLTQLTGREYGAALPASVQTAVEKINQADGLIIVCPEYNGSMPGALKYFIDHWSYPASFEYRPVAFIGLGGKFGGLRPVEHLQQVFGYRNGFIFPLRVFLTDIFTGLKDGKLVNPTLQDLLVQQAVGFKKFVQALQSSGLDANSMVKK